MSGNPNMQKIGKRKNPSGQKQPDWLFPATGKSAPTSTSHNDSQSKNKQEKELAKELLKRRAAGEPPKSTHPTELVEIIGAFLVENEFTKTSQSLQNEHKKRGNKSEAVPSLPSLSTIYNEWRELKAKDAGMEQRGYTAEQVSAARRVADNASSSGDSDSDEESEDSDVEMVDVPQAKKGSARKSPISSSSSASSSSESDADDEEEDEVRQPTTKEDRKTSSKPVVPKAKAKVLKRKASSSSESSSSSSSDSDSSSDDDAPKVKKLKTQATSSSSSSSSGSGSDSSSSSEDEDTAPKKVQIGFTAADVAASRASKPVKKTISISSDSSSDSSSESGSGSESESGSGSSSGSESSTNSAAQKVPLPASDSEASDSDSDSDSESDTAPKKTIEKHVSSDTSATLSDAPKKSSDSSSDSSSSDSESDPKPKAKKTTTTVSKTSVRNLSPPLPPTPVIKQSKKTNVPFSRIPKDVKVDDRLASNAFVPYDYAQKAHEDLIVTRGKGFTKEKNKKKKGSYRGGYIDVEGKKGIKFQD